MIIIDSQVHAYEADHVGRPWVGSITGPPSVTGDEMVAAMDKVGVDGAILVSPWSVYRTDTTYAVEVHRKYSGRFGLVAPVDPFRIGADDTIAEWGSTEGAVAIRLMAGFTDDFDANDPAVRKSVEAASRAGLPICVFCWGKLSVMDQLARLYPDVQFVLDHLGIPQPLSPPPPDEPFAALDEVLRLARHPNVAVKVTGACTLSHQPFPFDDLWQPLSRMFDTFGLDRCMWGTDWTRAVELVGYAEAVDSFRDHSPLSDADRRALMGGTATQIFHWSPSR